MPVVYLTVGFPGAGKTTICSHISDITGAHHIWADYERKSRFQDPKYTLEENDALYGTLNAELETHLASGRDVIYDTAFNYYHDRELIRGISRKYSYDTVIIWVKISRDIAKNRAIYPDDSATTRILGAMSEPDFERLCDLLEEPRQNERTIAIEGQDMTREKVADLLESFFNG
jgi:predicted kinase